jgi:sugar phosphate isomerase/epimerase
MHTQLGIFAKHISRSTSEELFDALAGFGFDCTQFNAACLGIPSLPDRVDAAPWSRAARAAKSAGIKVVALSATFNLLDENKLRLADNFRRLKVLAEGATILGTDLLTLCSGTRNQQDMWTYHPQNQSPEAWQEMVDAMRRAVEVAVEYDVNLGIEPEVANVVSNASDGARLIRELQSNRIRIVFDPANLYRPPSDPRRDKHVITDALRLLSDRIAIAHGKDVAAPTVGEIAHPPSEGLYGHVAAGMGMLDYHHYISELKRIAPKGVPLILHGLSEEQIPRSTAFVRRWLSAVATPAEPMSRVPDGNPSLLPTEPYQAERK